jgi:hypothetical protein
MINHVTSSADGDSQSLHETGPSRDSAPEGLETEPDVDILPGVTQALMAWRCNTRDLP